MNKPKLRKHQAEFLEVIQSIQAGSRTRIMMLVVTPGGGKSFIPVAAGKLIESGHADALAWVVPRQALQDQGEREFIDPFSRQLFNHNLTVRSSTNEVNPCRGTNGFITTYQALGVDTKKVIAHEFSTKRYILILDEYHHVEDGGIWHKALEPLFKQAAYVVLMTGTLERGDGKPIAFTKYRGPVPVLENSPERAVIRYSRRDALAERAILPISFHLSDGEFKWENQEGQTRHINSFQNTMKGEDSAALYTALKTDFAADLLRSCVLHWQSLRKRNPGARLLAVTADYDQAKDTTFMLKRALGLNAEIATSHKSAEAAAAIKHFKAGKIIALVTIAMAHEGLSVPPATHICSLTHIRSQPWIEQMVARGVRIDKAAGPYESQWCHVFAPRDKRFVEVMEKIKREQTPVLGKHSKPDEPEFPRAVIPGDGSGQQGPDIKPLDSKLTDQTRHLVGSDDAGRQAELPFVETVSEKEKRIRREIAKHVNGYAFKHRYKPQQINAELKQRFGKGRDRMCLGELEKLQQHIKKYYPFEVAETLKELPPGMEKYSKPRSKRRRVSAKAVQWTPRSEIMKASCYQGLNL